MDDFILVHEDKEYLAKCREEIEQELDKIGLSLHPTKTRLFPVSRRFKYVGFLFQLTHTGKVLMFVDPKIVKETRRRLKRLEKKHPDIALERAILWRSYASKGSSRKIINL